MKTIENTKINQISKGVFVLDETLSRFKGKDLFPQKTALAREAMKNVKLPLR